MNIPSDHLTQASGRDLLGRWVEDKCSVSFTELVTRYAPLVHGVAFRLLDEGSLRDDAAQLTFVELAKKSPRLVRHDNLAGWLHRTTLQKVMNLNRSERRARRRVQALKFEEHAHGDPSKCWERFSPEIDQELAKLSKADRELILQRYFIGLSGTELARHFKLSEGVVAKRLSRAMEKLRTRLGKKFPGLTTSTLTAAFTFSHAGSAEAATAIQTSAATWAEGALNVRRKTPLAGDIAWSAKLIGGCAFVVAVFVAGTVMLKSEQEVSPEILAEMSTPSRDSSHPTNRASSRSLIKEEDRRDEEGNYLYQVTGQVTDRFAGVPLEGVEISAFVFEHTSGYRAGEAFTGHDGRYHLTVTWKKEVQEISIDPRMERYSRYLVQQSGSGSKRAFDEFSGSTIGARVDLKKEVTLDFRMTATTSLKGKVLGSERNPVAGYEIMISHRSTDPIGHQILKGGIESDKNGLFEIDGFPRQGSQGEKVILEVIHPESRMKVASRTYPVTDGVPLFQEIEIPSSPILKGRVLDMSGQPAKDCRIILKYLRKEWSNTFKAISDNDGKFEISLPQIRSYEVKVISSVTFARCEGEIEVDGAGEITLNLGAPDSKFLSTETFQFQGLVLRPIPHEKMKPYWPGYGKNGGLLIDESSNPTGWLEYLQRYRGEVINGIGSNGFFWPQAVFVHSPEEFAKVLLSNLKVNPLKENDSFIYFSLGESLLALRPTEGELENLRVVAGSPKKE